MSELDADREYIYADYASWGDDVVCELFDGKVYAMAPAPSEPHKNVSGELFGQLWLFLKDKPCKVFHAPFDICLFAKGDNEKTVVQPDVFVVCDRTKMDEKRCNGAPDFIIEVLSPSNASHDYIIKYNAYMHAGVREYWIIDPVAKYVTVNILSDSKFDTSDYLYPESLPVHVLEGCTIDMTSVFAEKVW